MLELLPMRLELRNAGESRCTPILGSIDRLESIIAEEEDRLHSRPKLRQRQVLAGRRAERLRLEMGVQSRIGSVERRSAVMITWLACPRADDVGGRQSVRKGEEKAQSQHQNV